MRVSELIGLRLEDITFRGRYLDLVVRGKGRKQRILSLRKEVGESLRSWLAVRGEAGSPEVFLNARGQLLTRSGVTYILDRHRRVAAVSCRSLEDKHVSPHVLRHTCAMTILKATRDTRKVALWLGHERTDTSEIYLQIDATERLQVLQAVTPPNLRPGRFRPPDKLIAHRFAGTRTMRSTSEPGPARHRPGARRTLRNGALRMMELSVRRQRPSGHRGVRRQPAIGARDGSGSGGGSEV